MAAIKYAHILLTSIYHPFSESLIKHAENLNSIFVYGTNLKQIDLAAARARNIQVENVTHYCDFDTAELILAELLFVARGLGNHQWRNGFHHLKDKNLGIIGMGGIGKSVAHLALGHGLNVSYWKPGPANQIQNLKACESLNELLSNSDIVSLCVPPHTQLFTADHFEAMKSDAILVSTAQGCCWEQAALLKWLGSEKGILILDRFAAEQLPTEHREQLKALPNVRISPAYAYSTVESKALIKTKYLNQVKSYLAQRIAQVTP